MSVRRSILCSCMLAAGAVALAAPTVPSTQPARRSAPSLPRLDDYSALWEHNMFLKNRRSTRPDRPQFGGGGSFSRPSRRPEQYWSLKGVFEENGQYIAFLENGSTYETNRLKVGDSLLQGKVAAIGLDYMDYESHGKITRVDIGHDLSGEAATIATAANSFYPTTGPTTQSSATQPAVPDDPNMSMEERLKLRRLREGNR